ncbi:hypothetical protein [Brevibacillus sp. SYSU BS000544]
MKRLLFLFSARMNHLYLGSYWQKKRALLISEISAQIEEKEIELPIL